MDNEPDSASNIAETPSENLKELRASVVLAPYLRHSVVVSALSTGAVKFDSEKPCPVDFALQMKKRIKGAEGGNLGLVSQMLAAQAITLDSMFTELARRMVVNMGDHLGATESYARLALKAQGNCRATLEALAKLHQPREQTVRHVHVNEGGQAIVADHFHQHAGGYGNGKSDKQSDATGGAGTCPALPCQDTDGISMPIASGEGAEAMPYARRHKSRRTQGQ